jgi:NAD(P)-dependent dehydrogenase (short-subunit alcohol dehydrogenase family)
MNRVTPVDLSGRQIIVTGATPGSLGAATAAAFAEWGADVVTTTRATLDLTDRASVAAFAAAYAREHDALDVLVNNAGVHLDLRNNWKAPVLVDGFEIHWRTNYLGTMHLTHLLLPLLLRADDARVVNVVSKLHVRGRNEFLFTPLTPYNSWNAYGLSKLALVHASNEIVRRYPRVGAYSLHPGSVYTHIADRGLEGHRVIGALRRVAAPIERRMLLSPADGAQTSLHCATAADLPSGYYRDCRPAEPSAEVKDADVARRLWDETQAWIESVTT